MTQRVMAGTKGLALAQEVGLDKFMTLLEERRTIPVQLRIERQQTIQRKREIEMGALLVARDRLELERARLLMEVLNAKGQDGKAAYTNEEARKAALVLKQAEDEAYQEALSEVRKWEGEVSSLQERLNEIELETKIAAEDCWGLRKLVDGAVAAINAVISLDGPKLPSQIAITAPPALPQIQIVAPDQFPGVQLLAPNNLPPVLMKGVA